MLLLADCAAKSPSPTPNISRPVSLSPTETPLLILPTHVPATLCVQEQYDQQEPDGSISHVWYMCTGDFHSLTIATAPPPLTPLAPIPTSTFTPLPTTSTPTRTPIPLPVLTPVCDPAYPDFCIPSPPPILACKDLTYKGFRVLPPDPHGFDGDHDGIGCET